MQLMAITEDRKSLVSELFNVPKTYFALFGVTKIYFDPIQLFLLIYTEFNDTDPVYISTSFLRWLKTVSNTYIWMGRYNHSLSLLDATIMVSKNCLIIGEDVGIIFVTQYVTIATV